MVPVIFPAPPLLAAALFSPALPYLLRLLLQVHPPALLVRQRKGKRVNIALHAVRPGRADHCAPGQLLTAPQPLKIFRTYIALHGRCVENIRRIFGIRTLQSARKESVGQRGIGDHGYPVSPIPLSRLLGPRPCDRDAPLTPWIFNLIGQTEIGT